MWEVFLYTVSDYFSEKIIFYTLILLVWSGYYGIKRLFIAGAVLVIIPITIFFYMSIDRLNANSNNEIIHKISKYISIYDRKNINIILSKRKREVLCDAQVLFRRLTEPGGQIYCDIRMDEIEVLDFINNSRKLMGSVRSKFIQNFIKNQKPIEDVYPYIEGYLFKKTGDNNLNWESSGYVVFHDKRPELSNFRYLINSDVFNRDIFDSICYCDFTHDKRDYNFHCTNEDYCKFRVFHDGIKIVKISNLNE